MKPLFLLLTIMMISMMGCSSIEVHTDYDKNLDLTRYKSYSWLKKPSTNNPLMDERLMAALDTQLQAKGWRLMPDGKGEVVLFGTLTAKENERIDTMYNGGGPGFWGRGFYMGGGVGMSTSTVTTYLVGTLVIDMFEAQSHRPLWRGSASGTISNNPEKNARNIQEAATKLFKDFPPGIAN